MLNNLESLRELVDTLAKIPPALRSTVVLTIAPLDEGGREALITTLQLLKQSSLFQDVDLIKALSAWDWNSHAPHTDNAILALVEELLEEYHG
jgi:hypothetical protein